LWVVNFRNAETGSWKYATNANHMIAAISSDVATDGG